ncbi:MAG: DUF4113 domain-containing protein [Ginsengibacter sp.]
MTGEIISNALKGFNIIFKEGYNYLKCGVMALDIVPGQKIQASLFDTMDRKKNKTAMQAMEKVNQSLRKDMVRLSTQGFEKRYRLKTEFISSHFTLTLKKRWRRTSGNKKKDDLRF